MKKYFKMIGILFKCAYGKIILTVLLSVVGGLTSALLVIILTNIINSAVEMIINTSYNYTWLIINLLLFALICLFNIIKENCITLLSIALSQKLRNVFLPMVFEKYNKIDYLVFENKDYLDLLMRVGTAPEEQLSAVITRCSSFFGMIVNVVSVLTVFSFASIWILPACIILGMFSLFIELKFAQKGHLMCVAQSVNERKAAYISGLITGRANIKENRIFGLYDYLNNKWRTISERLLNEKYAYQKKHFVFYFLSNIAECVFIVANIALMVLLLKNGLLSYGSFVSFANELPVLFGLITMSIPSLLSECKNDAIYIREFYDVLALPEKPENDCIKYDNIRLENVTFSYPNSDRQVLKNLNLVIHKNKITAIVGANGSGKSTIAKLILGLYSPAKGTVTKIDNYVSAVFQDFVKYELSVKENIAISDTSMIENTDRIIKAASVTTADSFISALNNGIDSRIGRLYPDGIDLSQGQWQQIAISRGYFAGSEVLILDEPTASLDPIAEAAVYNSFINSIKGKTGVVISHRLGSARMADYIAVISDGQVAEFGTHKELMALKGIYSKMFETQAALYKEEV